MAETSSRVPRAWVKPGAAKANRRLPPDRAAGPGCQAATVADGSRAPETDAPRWRKCASWMQGGLKDGRRKPATMRVAGWRPDEGREGEPDLLLLDVRQESEITVFVHHDIVRKVAEILCFLF